MLSALIESDGARVAPRSARSHASILIASDSVTEAALIRTLLADDFDTVALSVDPDKAVGDFQRHRPDVLLLAFKDLQKSEDFYLGLHRSGGNNPPQQHRAVILCTKEGVKQAYEMCRRGLFDDYVLFWPVNHDITRLLMAVHQALDALAAQPGGVPSAVAFAVQARGLVDSGSVVSQQLERAQDYIASTGRAVARAEHNIDTALENLSARLGGDSLDSSHSEIRKEMGSEIERLRKDSILPQLHTVSESMQPLVQWAGSVREVVTPHLESARALGALASQVRATVLVVDDDEFQHKLVARLLESEPYQLKCAASGSEALNVLCRTRPDLILMDLVMPDMNGLDVIRRLKGDPQLERIPVIMITGNSERETVLGSIQVGAIDFIVKPFDRKTLVAKLARALGTSGS